MKKALKALDRFADIVLAYRPKAPQKKLAKRKKKVEPKKTS